MDTSAAGAKEEGFGRGRIPSEFFLKRSHNGAFSCILRRGNLQQ